jgi:hypothetical protein
LRRRVDNRVTCKVSLIFQEFGVAVALRTGETLSLYAFPNAKHPLPVIPPIEAMKVCPITRDIESKAKLQIIVD